MSFKKADLIAAIKALDGVAARAIEDPIRSGGGYSKRLKRLVYPALYRRLIGRTPTGSVR